MQMPFLESVSDISGGPRSVLTAADLLERCLSDMLYSCGEEGVSFLASDLHPYKVRTANAMGLAACISPSDINSLCFT